MAFLLTLLSKLPISTLRRLGAFVARIINAQPIPEDKRGKGLRWTVRVNSYIAYPSFSKPERDAFEKACVKNQCMAAAEALKSWGEPPSFSIKQIKQVHNLEVLERALKNPKGMIAIVPHFGTWEMMNAWLNQFGAPTIMYKPIKHQAVNDFMLAGRQRISATLVPTDATGVKAIFKTLKNGGFTIILPDHTPDPSGGVFAPLYGYNTLTSTLTCKLASKTGCAVVGLSCIRREDGTGFDVYCDQVTNPDIWSKDMEVAASALNQQIETMIARAPTHYIWGYRRYRASKDFKSVYTWAESQHIDYFVHKTHLSADNTALARGKAPMEK